MPVAIKKYKFHTTKIEFYGFIIELKKLSIDLKKISDITELELFLGFCNYCKRFIKQ